MKRNLRKLFMVSVAIFGIGGSADVFAVNDKSVTDEQTENLIYNPNFSLVRENSYCELIGWNVHDKTVSNPLTGGIGATSATAERVWVRFDNAKGSVNLDGKENTYSTAATFVFPDKPNKFCSSSSEYVYGEDDDYLLNLKPNCRYDFCAQLGYLNEEERGSVTFEIVAIENVEMALPEYVARTFTYTPTTCVSDTTKTPDVIRFSFITRCLGNSQNFKIVVKNTNTNDHWVLVMSNLRLYESESQNLIYNPNFSLVSENEYGELYGWTVYDQTVEYPLTGGIGATSATADKAWAKFDNTEGGFDINGNPLTNSTAASFYFPEKPTYFCSSKSQYVYGDVAGHELLLEPNSHYSFWVSLGYLNYGETGSVTFEFVNKKTGHVVGSYTVKPKVCISDTTLIPERVGLNFDTDPDADEYKLVVKNANPNDYWTLVMSNLELGEYYYELEDNDDLLTSLTEELSITNILLQKKMNSDVENALREAKLTAESVGKTTESSDIIKILDTLKEKNKEAEVSVKLYEDLMNDVVTYQTAAEKGFDELGCWKFKELMKLIEKAIADGTITATDSNVVKNAYYEGLIAQLSGDFTELIVNPGFEDGLTGWEYYAPEGGDTRVAPTSSGDDTYGIKYVNGKTHVDGSAPLYNNLFYTWVYNNGERGGRVSQTVKNLPNGKYRVSAYVSALTGNSVFLFANDEYSEPCYPAPDKYCATQTYVDVVITNGEITFGAIGGVDENGNVPGGVFPDFPNVLGASFKCDAFTLEYLGAAASQEDIYNSLMATCASADQYKDEPMNGDIRKQLMDVYDEAKAQTVNSDAALLEFLNLKLVEYTNKCLPSIEIYKQVNAWIEKADNLDKSGQLAFQELAKDVIEAYANRTITDGQSELDILEDKLRVAAKAQTDPHTDWTYAIYNPSFENKNAHWFVREGCKSFETVKVSGDGTTMPWNFVTGNRYAYKNNTGDSPIMLSCEQKVDSVQNGLYWLKVTVYTNSSTMKVFGNNLQQTITKCSSLDDVREIEQIIFVQSESYINFGIVGELNANEEIRVDNFRLEYISRDIDISEEAVPEGVPMYYKTRQAQTDALLKFKMNPQPVVISAAIEAIQNAKTSAEYYRKVKAYVDSLCNSVKSNNVSLSDDEVREFCNQFNPIYVAWSECTLTTEDCIDILSRTYSLPEKAYNDVDVDIAVVNNEKSENTTTPVVSQTEKGDTYYVYEPEDATKNQAISFDVPAETVKAGKKYYVIIVLVPTDETRTRPTYLTFELKGAPHKLYDRPSTPVDNVTNVLGSYLYSGEKEERLVYEFTSDVDIESASIRIVTDNPTDDNTDCTNAIGLKQVSLAAETDNSTAIETVASEHTDVVPVGMYSVSGIKQSSFRKGINVVRLSDGSVIKIQR